MSRVGKEPVEIPSGVKVSVEGSAVLVEGSKGKLRTPIPAGIKVEVANGEAVARRENEQQRTRALHGLTRALIANAVHGVSQGFSKQLYVVGIGYRADVRGKHLNLTLGHSHPIDFPIPEGIDIKVEREQSQISNYTATITIEGADKYRVGQVAADIRNLRPPDAYKGKGVRYSDEIVRTKVGKKGA